MFKITDFWPGKAMCKKAGFELWKLDGRQYVVPFFGPAAGDESINSDPLGYLTAEQLMIGEHEMGDFQGQGDCWKGVHRFDVL